MSATLRSDPGEDAVSLYGAPPGDDMLFLTPPPRGVGSPAPAEPPPAAAPPDPAVWQAELVELLAAIEHVRWSLRGLKPVAGGAALLSFAEGTLQACEGLARDTAFAAHTAEAQGEAVAKAGAFVSKLAVLRPAAAPGGLFRSVFSAFAPEAAPLDPLAVQDALQAHHEALNAYFALFTDHFQSSKAARGWVDAASGFLADYKAMVRDLV